MTDIKTQTNAGPALYRSILGERYTLLPDVIQRMHNVTDVVEARGEAEIRWGNSILSRLTARFLGMPPPGTALPAHVKFIRTEQVEILRRRYGDATLETLQMRGDGADRDFLLEAFGPVTLIIRLVATAADLRLELYRAKVFGIALPRRLWPRLDAREHADGDVYHFRVVIGLPMIGRIIEYSGSLTPVVDEDRAPGKSRSTTDADLT